MMTYHAVNARHRRNEWAGDPAQVINLARDLIRVGVLPTPDHVLEYFEQPTAYSREHEWWMAHGCTDDPDRWADAGWLRKDT
jgi:hypothetical protein